MLSALFVENTEWISPNGMLDNKIIEHARARGRRGVKIPVILTRGLIIRARGKEAEKCGDAGARIVRCTLHSAAGIGTYVPRAAFPRGPKKSHIHGIYGGIALLEHPRTTTTMHRDALLRARRAIRVMHRNAPGDSFSPLSPIPGSFSPRNLFALLRKGGRFCARGTALVAREAIDFTARISTARHTRDVRVILQRIQIGRTRNYNGYHARRRHFLTF